MAAGNVSMELSTSAIGFNELAMWQEYKLLEEGIKFTVASFMVPEALRMYNVNDVACGCGTLNTGDNDVGQPFVPEKRVTYDLFPSFILSAAVQLPLFSHVAAYSVGFGNRSGSVVMSPHTVVSPFCTAHRAAKGCPEAMSASMGLSCVDVPFSL